MAVSDGSPTPQMVGNAFVEQYYSILHQNPDQVHRFYQESSVLSRSEEDGSMTTVTSIADINKKILSQDYTNFRVEILSADAQPSYKDGVIVLVTGYLTGSDNLKRKFTQSFFLAPQDKGYFVLNDVFRYVDEFKSIDIESAPANDAEESAPTDALVPESEPQHVPENILPAPIQNAVVDTDTTVSKEVDQPIENVKLPVAEKVVPVNHVKEPSHQEHRPITEKAASPTQEDLPKKSFASIVNALKENAAPFHVRASPVKPVEQPRVSIVPAPETPVPNTVASEKNNENSGKAHAIFVANLSMNATVEQLEEVFKKFGPIKPDGIQVRSNRQQGSCFGFVEFESATSLQSALEASPPIILDNRKLSIEERRANNDKARFSSGRGGYRNDRNDNFRGRGNFGGGGRGYSGRNDFEKRGEFSGRPRGSNNNYGRSNGESAPNGGYQNGGGKTPRQPVKAQ